MYGRSTWVVFLSLLVICLSAGVALGAGEVVMNDSIWNEIRGITGTSTTITHGAGHTIRGAGYRLDAGRPDD